MEKIVIILGTRRNVWEWSYHVTRVKIRIVTKQNQAVLKQRTLQSLIQIVGTLKDGYIRKVPLPRVPRIQSTSHMQHMHDTCYFTQVPRIPTWSDLTRSLAGLGRSVLRPFSLSLV